MNLIPDIKLTKGIGDNGIEYVTITRHWLWWNKTLCSIPVRCNFWPDSIALPLPKSTRFPKQPTPTEDESRLVAELMETRGYKVLTKYWVWQALIMAHRCTTTTSEEDVGMFQGFLRARIIPLQIANWGEQKEELEEEESMYSTMARMDREAPQEY